VAINRARLGWPLADAVVLELVDGARRGAADLVVAALHTALSRLGLAS
jgi:hypothetical protein